jgi:hypothetical protein
MGAIWAKARCWLAAFVLDFAIKHPKSKEDNKGTDHRESTLNIAASFVETFQPSETINENSDDSYSDDSDEDEDYDYDGGQRKAQGIEAALPLREQFWRSYQTMRPQSAQKARGRDQDHQSPQSLYLAKCIKNKLRPETVVLKLWQPNSNGKVELGGYMMGDNVARTLADCLCMSSKQAAHYKGMNLRRNRLTDRGLAPIVQQMSQSIAFLDLMLLDLSQNKIGPLGAAAVCNLVESNPRLSQLIMEDCSLADNLLANVCAAVSNSLSLSELSIAHNAFKLSVGGEPSPAAVSLAAMISPGGATNLISLSASWCTISGPSALAIAKALAESALETADFSWNCFGKLASSSAASRMSQCSVAEALGEALAGNISLTHLDLRHNQLGREDCSVLAKGFAENHTLLGIHMAGNNAHVDSYGFIVPAGEGRFIESMTAHVFVPINARPTLLPSTAAAAEHGGEGSGGSGGCCSKVALEQGNNWVTEGWSNVDFVWTPGVSDAYSDSDRPSSRGASRGDDFGSQGSLVKSLIQQQGGKLHNVFVRTSFDDWRWEPLNKKVKKVEKGKGKDKSKGKEKGRGKCKEKAANANVCFECSRMCPPGRIEYSFVCEYDMGHGVQPRFEHLFAADQPHIRLDGAKNGGRKGSRRTRQRNGAEATSRTSSRGGGSRGGTPLLTQFTPTGLAPGENSTGGAGGGGRPSSTRPGTRPLTSKTRVTFAAGGRISVGTKRKNTRVLGTTGRPLTAIRNGSAGDGLGGHTHVGDTLVSPLVKLEMRSARPVRMGGSDKVTTVEEGAEIVRLRREKEKEGLDELERKAQALLLLESGGGRETKGKRKGGEAKSEQRAKRKVSATAKKVPPVPPSEEELQSARMLTMPGRAGRVNFAVVSRRQEGEQIPIPPRTKGAAQEQAKRMMVKPKWSFPKSIFADYRQDTDSVMGDAFAADWGHSSAAKMFKGANEKDPKDPVFVDMEATKALLQTHYRQMVYTFKNYAANTTEMYTVSLNAYSDFVNEINVLEKGDGACNLSNIDMIFIGANMTGQPHKLRNPKRMLTRFQLAIDVVMQIASAKFKTAENNDSVMQSPAAGPKGGAVTAMVRRLLTEHVLGQAQFHDAEKWRWRRLYNEPCDLVFKLNAVPLKRLYSRFSGAEDGIGEQKRVSMSEWVLLMSRAGFCDEIFTVREVRLSYIRAKQTEVDEQAGNNSNRKMLWIEFVEAIARAAEMMDLTYSVVKDPDVKLAQSAFLAKVGGADDPPPSVSEGVAPGEAAEAAVVVAWVDGAPGTGKLAERLEKVVDALLLLLQMLPKKAKGK